MITLRAVSSEMRRHTSPSSFPSAAGFRLSRCCCRNPSMCFSVFASRTMRTTRTTRNSRMSREAREPARAARPARAIVSCPDCDDA